MRARSKPADRPGAAGSSPRTVGTIPCAIYTRKSSEEGLEQDFNSLHAQRESCAAFVQSQKSLGWVPLAKHYDDGGFSGGNTERPGLQQLLADIQAHKIQVVVVYKVDRLTRSLADFAKLVELFDAHGVSFVSVTQQFNTTTSMGRLTLNVLLSFAQFEREVTGERIRDKIAASKRKGMWMGGMVPMGYLPKERSLSIHEDQALQVREIFKLYLACGSVREVKEELDRRGWRTPLRPFKEGAKRSGGAGNRPFSRGNIYRMLSNPIYIGQIVHKDETFPGNHPAIIRQDLWDDVQAKLAENRQGVRERKNAEHASLLAGLVFDERGQRLTPSHAQKKTQTTKKRYRYYVSEDLLNGEIRDPATRQQSPGLRVPAYELETAVIQGLQGFLNDEGRVLESVSGQDADAEIDIKAVLVRAKLLALKLSIEASRECIRTLQRMVQCITVCETQVNLDLRARVLMEDEVEVPYDYGGLIKTEVEEPSQNSEAMQVIRISVPLEIRRWHRSMKMVIGEQSAPKRIETRLVDRLVNAHDWFWMLASGKCTSVGELAKTVGQSTSYVTRTMYLAFLAPDIVEQLVAGDGPPGLTAERLGRMVPLPTNWDEQRNLLGAS